MKVSKNTIDLANTVVRLTNSYLIGAGFAALMMKVCDKEIFAGMNNWSSKTKIKYTVAMTIGTAIIIVANTFREGFLNDTYEYYMRNEDEIDIGIDL